MSESLEVQIARLEKQIAEILELHEGLYKSGQPIPTVGPFSPKTLDETFRKLNNARQVQLSHLLTLVHESSNRLESATRNLQQTSESQLKVAESQAEISKSQVKVMKDLLKSSHLLEQFTVYLMVLAALNIFIVEYVAGLFKNLYGIVGAGGLVGAILAMFILGGYLPRLRKLDKSEE
jgi:hypothetical protein